MHYNGTTLGSWAQVSRQRVGRIFKDSTQETGIAGLTAAIALHDKGHQVTVLERSASLQTLGGALSLNVCAMRILDQYDLLQTMIDRFGELGLNRVQRRWQDGRALMTISTQATKESFGSG